MSLEQNLSAQVTQIEIRIKQLNYYVGVEIVSPQILARIRGIDNSANRPLRDIIEEVHVECSELNEAIEVAYDDFFRDRNVLRRFWLAYGYELSGAALALGVVWLCVKVILLIF
ncbi:hypothetical protein [Marinobacter shengliensis]